MNRRLRFILAALGLAVLFALTHCADPLDITNQPVPPHQNPSDTLYVVDTVYVIDTVTQTHFDTTYIVDTVFQGGIDTLVVVDTVIQIQPDTVIVIDTVNQLDTVTVVDTVYVITDSARFMCGRIESCQKEIIWLLQNEAGQYQLNFAACIEKDQPPQSLTVEIAGTEYTWNTAERGTFVVNSWLNDNATVTITSKKPPARGHAVYICLSLIRE